MMEFLGIMILPVIAFGVGYGIAALLAFLSELFGGKRP